MKILNKIGLFAAAALIYVACEKAPELVYHKDGSAVALTASSTSLTPTAADSNRVILTLNWTSPEYATDSNTYKYVLELDSSSRNFTRPNTVVKTGARSQTFTGKEINNMLLNYGFALGVPVDLDFRITSSYANNNQQLRSNIVKIRVTPYNDPSVLTSQNTTVSGTLNEANNPSNRFSWTRAFTGYSGTVTYTIQYDSAGKNFSSPQLIPGGGAGVLQQQLTVGEMNEIALNEGVAGGNPGRIEFRVRAVTAQGAVSFSNAVAVTINTYIPLLRFYMPGSYQAATGQGNNWDPGTAPELIRDLRPGALNRLYYTYIWLPAGAEFKVTQGRAWDINYGGSGGVLQQNGGNFSVATSGWYRVSIDRTSMRFDIREGRMGFVGGAVGAGWNPGGVFPNFAMGLAATNLFVGLTNFTGGEWKMIDFNDWNSGDINVTNARSYGANGGSGSSMEINAGNFPSVPTPGRYRVMWDGRNRDNIRYEIHPATEMRVVGNGINGVPEWNPGASPQMTYQGNGVWTITLNLIGGRDIKFLAGNAWGAFDYEDASGGSTATGVARRIRWESGDNFKTPTASGTYTITLNEHAQTVTIN